MEESELGRNGTRRRGNAFPLPTQAHRVKTRRMQKRRRKKGDAFPFASRALRARTRRMCKRKKQYNLFPLPSLSHRARTWTMRKWRRKKGYAFPSPSCAYTTRCFLCSDISKWLDSLVSSFPRHSFASSRACRLSKAKKKKERGTVDRLKTNTRDVTISGDDLCSTFHKLWDLVLRWPIPSWQVFSLQSGTWESVDSGNEGSNGDRLPIPIITAIGNVWMSQLFIRRMPNTCAIPKMVIYCFSIVLLSRYRTGGIQILMPITIVHGM